MLNRIQALSLILPVLGCSSDAPEETRDYVPHLRVLPSSGPKLSVGGVDLLSSVNIQKLFSDEDLSQLQDVDGVDRVWPESWTRFPVQTAVTLPGTSPLPAADLVLLGVSSTALFSDFNADGAVDPASTVPQWSWEEPESNAAPAPVPVALPKAIVSTYNHGFQPAHSGDIWPKIDDGYVKNISFTFCPGSARDPTSRDCTLELSGEVVAIVEYDELAILVPTEVVHWAGEQLGNIENPRHYSSAVITLEPGANLRSVQSKIGDLGWNTEHRAH